MKKIFGFVFVLIVGVAMSGCEVNTNVSFKSDFDVINDFVEENTSIPVMRDNMGEETQPEPEFESDIILQSFNGIEFEYPKKWGTLELDSEEHYVWLKTSSEGGGEIPIPARFIVAAYTPKEIKTRGAHFGDIATVIDSREFLAEYCDSLIVRENILECEFETNKNGVEYVKLVKEIDAWYGNEGPFIDVYYFVFDDNHEFRGIAMSSEEMQQAWGKDDLLEDFERMMESMKFR